MSGAGAARPVPGGSAVAWAGPWLRPLRPAAHTCLPVRALNPAPSGVKGRTGPQALRPLKGVVPIAAGRWDLGKAREERDCTHPRIPSVNN